MYFRGAKIRFFYEKRKENKAKNGFLRLFLAENIVNSTFFRIFGNVKVPKSKIGG
jgi:hypothetical protein